jgi:hypothetical protein
MIKYLKYILCIFCLLGCFEINKPFENDKIAMPDIKAINSSLYINEIVGLHSKTENELRKKIYHKILNKNIITSYKFFNRNSYILKSTVVEYKSLNKKKIIISLHSPISKDIKKLELFIPDNNFNNIQTQEIVSERIAEFVKNVFYKKRAQKKININAINGLENYKGLKSVFVKKLNYLFTKQSIVIVNADNSIKNNYSIIINFYINEVKQEKINLRVNWEIYNKNNELIGDLKQENTFLKSLLLEIWPEISSKIIEMSLNEIKILTNVDK